MYWILRYNNAELYFPILVCWLILVYVKVHLWTLVLFGVQK